MLLLWKVVYKDQTTFSFLMPAPNSIYLIRHGESEVNLSKSINTIKADHLVELSPRGQEQAVEAGTKLGAIPHGTDQRR